MYRVILLKSIPVNFYILQYTYFILLKSILVNTHFSGRWIYSSKSSFHHVSLELMGRIVGFMSLSRVLVLCEMQTALSRMWTWAAKSIFYDGFVGHLLFFDKAHIE